MGFLDRAKKLADQAKEKAGQAKELADKALADVQARSGQTGATTPPAGGGPAPGAQTASGTDVQWGTPYVPGMLGRPGWREQGLVDPAAILPIGDRDRAGVPRSTKSQILEEPYGMGRRWSSGGRSAALFYQLYPEHQSWQPPATPAPLPDVAGASAATLPDGRSLVFIGASGRRVVLEVAGLDDAATTALARTVAAHLTAD